MVNQRENAEVIGEETEGHKKRQIVKGSGSFQNAENERVYLLSDHTGAQHPCCSASTENI